MMNGEFALNDFSVLYTLNGLYCSGLRCRESVIRFNYDLAKMKILAEKRYYSNISDWNRRTNDEWKIRIG